MATKSAAEILAESQAKFRQEQAAYKELVKESIPPAVKRLEEISDMLQQAKADTFEFFRDILTTKAEVYGVKEDQQSHTFSAGDYTITIGYNINDGWDDTVTAGITRVREFIASLTESEETDPDKIKKNSFLVNNLMKYMKMDRQGNLNANRVLEMQKEAENSGYTELIESIQIIREAYKPSRSTWFIEATKRGANGKKINIPLSMSTVPFPEGFTFDFVIQNNK